MTKCTEIIVLMFKINEVNIKRGIEMLINILLTTYAPVVEKNTSKFYALLYKATY